MCLTSWQCVCVKKNIFALLCFRVTFLDSLFVVAKGIQHILNCLLLWAIRKQTAHQSMQDSMFGIVMYKHFCLFLGSEALPTGRESVV